jgi:hypothetical protein
MRTSMWPLPDAECPGAADALLPAGVHSVGLGLSRIMFANLNAYEILKLP